MLAVRFPPSVLLTSSTERTFGLRTQNRTQQVERSPTIFSEELSS